MKQTKEHGVTVEVFWDLALDVSRFTTPGNSNRYLFDGALPVLYFAFLSIDLDTPARWWSWYVITQKEMS